MNSCVPFANNSTSSILRQHYRMRGILEKRGAESGVGQLRCKSVSALQARHPAKRGVQVLVPDKKQVCAISGILYHSQRAMNNKIVCSQ
jgi:hypothetical protein